MADDDEDDLFDDDGLPTHADLVGMDDANRTTMFLEMVRKGVGEETAALAVGWSRAKLKEKRRSHEFTDMLALSRDLQIESVERAVYDLAVKHKHFNAMQFF